jgi:DNA-binding NtrC family response regulator
MSDNIRILVVDDEEVVRQAYLRTLAGERCSVEAASDGADALRRMREAPYDVVLLDLRMPGMNGLDVLKAIKQSWPASEVVVVTGYPGIDTAKASVALGAHDYLAKPVGPDDIVHATRSAVLHKRWALRREHEITDPQQEETP